MESLLAGGVVFVLAGLCLASAGAVPYETVNLIARLRARNPRLLQVLDDPTFAHARLQKEAVAL